MIERLHVFHRRRLVGTLDHQPDGRMAFAYAEVWLEAAGRFAISVSLPLASGPNRDPAAHAFFANLLPEGLVREAVARRLGLSATNDFALLAAIGGECAGALTVLPEAVDTTPESGAYEPLPEDFVSRLPGRSSVLAEMVARRGTRLSLAGAQDKLPVYLAPDGRLMLPMNGAPSTHILKVPSGRFKHLPANEVLTLRLARALSLDAAEANLVQVGGAACALVRRYDRTVRDGQVVRLHQEDLCQALGRMPSMKYQEEGGPGFQDAMQVVREHSASPLVDARRLLGWQAFNLLAGNSDGHGKNLSLLYGRDGGDTRLAPFYDLVCTRVYPGIDRRLAMGIGEQRDPGQVARRDVDRLAQASGIGSAFAADVFVRLAQAMPAAFDEVSKVFREAHGDSPIIARMADVIERQCRRSKKLLTER